MQRNCLNIPVDAVPELLEELLVVFFGDLEDPVNELLPVGEVHLRHVHHAAVLVLAVLVLDVGLNDARPEPVVGRQLLDSGPLQGLLVLVDPAVPRACEHVFHAPARPAHAPAAHVPARTPP